jgi:two-component system nitrogen regulation response regulator GlnG
MARLLIVDDEPNVLYSLQAGLAAGDLEVLTAPTGRQGIELVERKRPDVVILDVRLPDLSGLDAFEQIRAVDPHLPVIIVTAFAATGTAIEAMKRGAFEYLLKPVDLHQLRGLVGQAVALRRLHVLAHPPLAAGAEADLIVGQSAPMQEVYKAIGRIAPQDVTVLILGESGTGKELVARALHQHSKRADKPFLAINCAAIPESLLESELFGHERGAFTGADRQRVGKFEQAHGGTLFLDEVGDLTPAAQAKLLRLLQEQQFERVGGREVITADVRIVAATNQRLGDRAAAGEFRHDLYYRLNGFVIDLPPLRARKDDISVLVEHFVRLSNARLGKQVRSVTPDALNALERHHWPGNIRELQNAVRYAVIQAVTDVVTVECLPAALRGGPTTGPQATGAYDVLAHVRSLLAQGGVDIYRQVLTEVERVMLAEVLRHVGNNQVHASELLGISRTTLRNKLAAATTGELAAGDSGPGE